MSEQSWKEHAACRKSDPAIFFPVYYQGVSAAQRERAESTAKELCSQCPVDNQCLEYGLVYGDPEIGIWGGLNDLERRRLIRKRKDDKRQSKLLNDQDHE